MPTSTSLAKLRIDFCTLLVEEAMFPDPGWRCFNTVNKFNPSSPIFLHDDSSSELQPFKSDRTKMGGAYFHHSH